MNTASCFPLNGTLHILITMIDDCSEEAKQSKPRGGVYTVTLRCGIMFLGNTMYCNLIQQICDIIGDNTSFYSNVSHTM
jgi:hypothetical protein